MTRSRCARSSASFLFFLFQLHRGFRNEAPVQHWVTRAVLNSLRGPSFLLLTLGQKVEEEHSERSS